MPFFQRLLAALPDALTAVVFLCTWIDPALPGYDRVKNLMLTMLFEFIVMHSGVMIGTALQISMATWKRFLALLGLSAVYGLFVFFFAVSFGSTWPIWVFGWLFLCRFWHLLVNRTTSEQAALRMNSIWLVSALAYLGGCFLSLILPLPRLGITPQVVTALHFPRDMSGAWIDRPWIVLAFGVLYFSALAWAKFRDFDLSKLGNQAAAASGNAVSRTGTDA